MRIQILIICLLLLIASQFILSQVSINTNDPQGIFHIHPNITQNNNRDEIVVSQTGNMGIGILAPSAKMHILNSTITTTDTIFRLQDNTEELNKVLVSDNSAGNGFWGMIVGSGGKIYNITPATSITYPPYQQSLVLAMPIEITGNYLISIRWWGAVRSWNAYFRLYEGSTSSNNVASDGYRDGIEYYTGIADQDVVISFTVNLFANATAGSFLKIYIEPQTDNWTIGSFGPTPAWCPSVLLFRI